jgi:hypothetical protein
MLKGEKGDMKGKSVGPPPVVSNKQVGRTLRGKQPGSLFTVP